MCYKSKYLFSPKKKPIIICQGRPKRYNVQNRDIAEMRKNAQGFEEIRQEKGPQT